jgi:hypothetical protein
MGKLLTILGLTILVIIAGLFFDSSTLTHQVKSLQLVDKWHEQSCVPIIDDKGNYLSENCSDDWTFVVLENGARNEVRVSGPVFKTFVVGDRLKREFDEGRLGVFHNDDWSKHV